MGVLLLSSIETMSGSTSTYTLLRPEGLLSLIETNGEITQTAVLNNSLHSLLSGSMVRKWEPGSKGCRSPLLGWWGAGDYQKLLEEKNKGCGTCSIKLWSVTKIYFCNVEVHFMVAPMLSNIQYFSFNLVVFVFCCNVIQYVTNYECQCINIDIPHMYFIPLNFFYVLLIQ